MEKILKNDINYVVGDAIVKEMKNELVGIMYRIEKNNNYEIGDAIVKEMKNELISIKRNLINLPKSIKSFKEDAEINYVIGDSIVKEMKNDVLCLKKTLRVNGRTR